MVESWIRTNWVNSLAIMSMFRGILTLFSPDVWELFCLLNCLATKDKKTAIVHTLTAMTDQYRVSPYYTISNIEVLTLGINSWSSTSFLNLISQELYGRQSGELLMRSWEWKVESALVLEKIGTRAHFPFNFHCTLLKSLALKVNQALPR